jgi:hypothetical protein
MEERLIYRMEDYLLHQVKESFSVNLPQPAPIVMSEWQ